jgi:hypothetical protein
MAGIGLLAGELQDVGDMRTDKCLDESGRQYAAAHEAHYVKKDLRGALELYRSVVDANPNSREAKYSRAQVRNIVRDVVPAGELLEAQVGCALAHFEIRGKAEALVSPVTPTRLGFQG